MIFIVTHSLIYACLIFYRYKMIFIGNREELYEQILDKGIINEDSKSLIYEDLWDWCADMP